MVIVVTNGFVVVTAIDTETESVSLMGAFNTVCFTHSSDDLLLK